MAVAGFAADDLAIEAKANVLTVKGEKKAETDEDQELLYRGIASRAFERRFQLADYVEVKGADLVNGLLHFVDLVREIPEAMKPRTITIGAGRPRVKPPAIPSKSTRSLPDLATLIDRRAPYGAPSLFVGLSTARRGTARPKATP